MVFRVLAIGCVVALYYPFIFAYKDWQGIGLIQQSAALLQSKQGVSQALAPALQAVELTPEQLDAHIQALNVYKAIYASDKNEKILAEMTKHYTTMFKLSPHNARIHYEYSDVLSTSGDDAAALKQVELALKLDPNNYNYWAAKGIYLEILGEDAKAIAAYQKSYDLYPNKLAKMSLDSLRRE